MFERYTESARRTLFFARYECATLGSVTIETEHILLGLVREGGGVATNIFSQARLSYKELHAEIDARGGARERVSTSVEIPFSPETKRVLQHTAEEADRLSHSYIGTEHLLLGLLREERSQAASILARHGLRLAAVREEIVRLLEHAEHAASDESIAPSEIPQRIDAIKAAVDQFRGLPPDGDQAADLIARIQRELDWLKGHFH